MLFEECEDILGHAYYRTDNCLIFNVECFDAMSKLASSFPGSIDLAITSPPYNIGKSYESIMSVNEYIDWCERWIKVLHTLVCPDGTFWLNLGYFELPDRARAIPIAYMLWNRVPFYLIQEVVWHYGAGVAAKTMFSPRNEKFLWYAKNKDNYVFNLDEIRDPDVKYPNQKKNGKLKCNPLGKNPTDVWLFPKVTSGTDRSSEERTAHPAQFPLQVIDRIVKGSSNEGSLLFDPFMGSGTTAVAAISNKRKVIGFEINRDYCEIAATRIRAFERQEIQGSLFGSNML